ncbi:hypothetical protein E2562_037207 [Oryza meyeriana var. granulata]|uniref:Uncharacterized protein n=1 Tax=Oryza meyeriana var. granulata TaxID=110450 RepID=A0A6G1CB41_9ORYZ|nr:hypothetical protein E2562_037207 [Oryza meyeriana var. granulata]
MKQGEQGGGTVCRGGAEETEVLCKRCEALRGTGGSPKSAASTEATMSMPNRRWHPRSRGTAAAEQMGRRHTGEEAAAERLPNGSGRGSRAMATATTSDGSTTTTSSRTQ